VPGLSDPARIPPLRLQISAGLYGAFLLARGRTEGLLLAALSPEGVARSFWAAALCLPAFLGLRFLSSETSPDLGSLVADLSAYAASWAGYALASRWTAERLGVLNRWPRFIAAWNWCNVVQYLLLVLILPVPPGLVATWLGLVTAGYTLWLEWFVAREALGIPRGRAIGLVALDVAISLFLTGFVDLLSGP